MIKRNYTNNTYVGKGMRISQPVGNTSHISTPTAELYHNQIKPIMILLRLVGILPIEILQTGGTRFRLFSPVMAFSVCIYIFNIYCVYFVVFEEQMTLLHKKDFLSSVLSSVVMAGLFFIVIIPICMWIDMYHCVLYIKKWIQFHEQFLKVTRQHLLLSIRKLSLYVTIYITTVGLAASAFTSFLHDFNSLKLPWIFFLVVVFNSIGIFKITTYHALITTANAFVIRFQVDVKQRKRSAYLIGEYRILWLRLTKLVSETGMLMGKSSTWYLMSYLFLVSASLYGCLASFLSKENMTIYSLAMGLGFIISILSLYSICNRGHDVTCAVSKGIQEELQLLNPIEVGPLVYEEVKIFLQTIAMNPPVLSILGFVNINRGLFRSCVSTVVTYMIVLLQFSMGERGNTSDLNATLSNAVH